MFALLLRILLFVVLLPFLVLWLAAAAITWGADAILSASREQPRPPFAIARRTADVRFGSTATVFVVLLLVFGVAGGTGGSGTDPERSDPVVAAASAEREQDEAAEQAAAEKARADQREAELQAAREARRAERLERKLRAAERREARLATQRRRERREARARARQAALLAQEREQEEQEQAAAEDCHPSYEGACLDPNASDYDCEGGSGDGPEYTGTVRLVGPDEYDLERDDDGIACDAS